MISFCCLASLLVKEWLPVFSVICLLEQYACLAKHLTQTIHVAVTALLCQILETTVVGSVKQQH